MFMNKMDKQKHRYIVDQDLSLLAHASMPLHFWDENFYVIVFVINRFHNPLISYRSPLERIFHVKLDYITLKVFECRCHPYAKPFNDHKLQLRLTYCTFISYSPHHKDYKCLDDNGNLYISRRVEFVVTFPFAIQKSIIPSSQNVLPRIVLPTMHKPYITLPYPMSSILHTYMSIGMHTHVTSVMSIPMSCHVTYESIDQVLIIAPSRHSTPNISIPSSKSSLSSRSLRLSFGQ